MRRTVFLTLLCLFSCFCSFFRSKVPPYPSGVIFPLEKDGEVQYNGRIVDRIQKQGKHLYLSTKKAFVYCLDGEQRKVIWEFQAEDELVSPPFLGERMIYVYDKNSTLYCLDEKGKLRWKQKGEERISTGVSESHGAVYFGTEEGVLYALDQDNGQEQWRFQADQAVHSTPIYAEGMIIFGCDDHHLYFLDEKGRLLDRFEAGDKIRSTLLIDGKFLYFGSDDYCVYCLDLKKRREKWKVKIGCRVSCAPLADRKRVLLLCLNGILTCLDKKNGTIRWWQVVPSRSYYQLRRVGERVLVTSLSSLLVAFDISTGERVGEFKSEQQIQSNPLWLEPYVLVNLYDYNKERGSLVYLRKLVQVTLDASKKSPQKIGEELDFAASTQGFFRPEFEFFLSRLARINFHHTSFLLAMLWEKKMVQEKSKKESWRWFPEIPGVYLVGVKVADEKERAAAEMPFIVEKEKAQVTILSSKASPHVMKEEIIFQATTRGLQEPEFEFVLCRWAGIDFHPSLFLISTAWQMEVVQERSKKNTWAWLAEKPGVYAVGAKAADKVDEAEALIPFFIEREMDREMRRLIQFLVEWIATFVLL